MAYIISDSNLASFVQGGIIEHDFFDKPVSGGFNDNRLEPMLNITFSRAF